MKNKGLKILLSVLLVLCIIMAGALIGKEYIADNIKEAANRNGVDVVKDTSDAGKADTHKRLESHLEKQRITQLTVRQKVQRVHSLMQPKLRQQKRIHKSHRCQP